MHKGIGKVIKLIRLKKKIKQEYVCRKLGITNSVYSRFESNQSKLSDEKILKLYDLLNIKASSDDINDKIEDCFNKIYNDLCFMEIDKERFNCIYQYYPEVCSSLSYPKYLLGEMVYKIYYRDDVDINEYLFLEDYFEYFESYQIQLYYDLLGCYYVYIKEYDKALQYYIKASKYKGNVYSHSMLMYHLSILYRLLGKYSDALRCIEEAQRVFVRTVNLKRIVYGEYQKALINQCMNNYDYSIEKYFLCVDAFKLLDMKYEVIKVYEDIIWTYLIKCQYKDILELKDTIIKLSPYNAFYYTIIAFAYYKEDNIENAKIHIKNAQLFMNKKMDNIEKTMIKTFDVLINENYNRLKETSLKRLYKTAMIEGNKEYEKFSIELLCEFYKEDGNTEELNHYLYKMVNYRDGLE